MSLFDITTSEKQLKELELKTTEEDFWQRDTKETSKVLYQIKQLKNKVEQYRKIENEIINLEELTELANL